MGVNVKDPVSCRVCWTSVRGRTGCPNIFEQTLMMMFVKRFLIGFSYTGWVVKGLSFHKTSVKRVGTAHWLQHIMVLGGWLKVVFTVGVYPWCGDDAQLGHQETKEDSPGWPPTSAMTVILTSQGHENILKQTRWTQVLWAWHNHSAHKPHQREHDGDIPETWKVTRKNLSGEDWVWQHHDLHTEEFPNLAMF